MRKDSKQVGFAKDFLTEAQKKGVKSLAGAVGMPDKDDFDNICNMIAIYRKKSVEEYGYDILVWCVADAKRDKEQSGGKYESKAKGFNLVNKDSNMRYHFELPDTFVAMIQRVYPLMFSSTEHYHWFTKNFRELMIPERV